jgi:hypothetical protein
MSSKSGPLPLSNPNGFNLAIKESTIRTIAIPERINKLCPSVPGKKAARESKNRKINLKPAGKR